MLTAVAHAACFACLPDVSRLVLLASAPAVLALRSMPATTACLHPTTSNCFQTLMLLAASAVQLAIVGDVNHQLCCFLCLQPFGKALAGLHAWGSASVDSM